MSVAANSSHDQELIDAEDLRGRLLVERDYDGLDRLFSDDLIHIHSTGIRHTKSELIEYLRTRLAFISVQRSDLTIIRLPEAALMVGKMSNVMQPLGGGDRVSAVSHVTQLWVRGNNRWMLSTFQATRAAP